MSADPRAASLVTQPLQPNANEAFGYGPTSRRPSNPKLGFLYFDTSLADGGQEVVWTIRGWKVVGPAITVATTGAGTTAQRLALRPQPGFMYFDTSLQAEFAWSGSMWVRISPPDWVLTFVPSGPAVPMVGVGTTAQRPANPPYGFLYFNADLQREQVWNTVDWITIGPSTPSPPPPPSTGPTITSASSAFGVVGAAFSYQITAVSDGAITSYGCTATVALAAIGLTFSTSTGRLSGTPTTTYSNSFTLSATNGFGTTNLTFTLTVNTTTPSIPTVTSSASTTGVVGTAFSYQITATNYPTSYATDSATALAAVGLSLNSSSGLISGTPSGTFSATVTVSATNSYGSGSLPISFSISSAPVTTGRFHQVDAVMWCNEGSAVIGVTVESSTANTLAFNFSTLGGLFPPGTTWALYDPNGQILDQNDASGLALVSGSVPIALGGGYTLWITAQSGGASSFVVSATLSSAANFINASANGTVVGPSVSPPSGLAIALTASSIDPASRLSEAAGYELIENGTGGFVKGDVLRLFRQRSYSINFGGVTTNNPLFDIPAGITTFTASANANGATSHRVIIEING